MPGGSSSELPPAPIQMAYGRIASAIPPESALANIISHSLIRLQESPETDEISFILLQLKRGGFFKSRTLRVHKLLLDRCNTGKQLLAAANPGTPAATAPAGRIKTSGERPGQSGG